MMINFLTFMKNYTFKFQYKLALFIILLLLVEGLYYYYYYSISRVFDFLDHKYQTGFNNIVWSENGIVEMFQVILIFFSIIFIFKAFKICRIKETRFILAIYILGLFFYFFEEISWGQHFFNWNTPEFFEKINNQNETNLHNINNLFNQLPRNLVLIWCSSSFILIKLNLRKLDSYRLKEFILPNENLKYISYLLIFFLIPNFIVSNLEFLEFADREVSSHERLLKTLSILISFNFIRLSELHELIFDYYIISHSYYLYILMKKNM